MKLKVKFSGIKSKRKYHKVIEIKECYLSHTIKDELLPKLFEEERELEKKYNDILRIIGIEDID